MMPPSLPNTALLCESLLAAKEREDKNGKWLTQLFMWIKTTEKKEEEEAISTVPFSSLVMLKATTTWITHPLSQLFLIPVPPLLVREAEDHFRSPSPQVSHVDLSEFFSLDVSFFSTRSWELNPRPCACMFVRHVCSWCQQKSKRFLDHLELL